MNLFMFLCHHLVVLVLMLPYLGGVYSNSTVSIPSIVNIGAIFTFDSSIGKVSKLAMEQAVQDVNSNSSILHSTQLVLHMKSSNCSGFDGMIQGNCLIPFNSIDICQDSHIG